MKKILLIFAIIFYTYSNAQTSVIQDGEGETSYQTEKNLFTLNASNSSIGFAVSPIILKHTDRLNLTATFEAKDGTTKILDGGKIQFSGKLGLLYIIDCSDNIVRGATTSLKIRKLYFGAEGIYSKINVYDSTKTFNSQVFVKNNIGFKVNVGYNQLHSAFGKFSYGVALSGGIKDNSDNIDQSEVITSTFMQEDANNIRTHSVTENVYDAKLLDNNIAFSNLNLDIGHHLFKDRFFTNLHFKYLVLENSKPIMNSAIGLFFLQDGAPLEAIAGIQLQMTDMNNSLNSELNNWERTSLVLTVGFPFN